MKTPAPAPIIVDARGHHCPVPTLRLQRALEGLAPGASVRLLADDPMARIDVPHFAAARGLRIVEQACEGLTLSFLVEAGASPDGDAGPGAA